MMSVGVMKNISKEIAAEAATKLKGKGLEEKLHGIIVVMRRLIALQAAVGIYVTNHCVQRLVIIARMPKKRKRLMLTIVNMTNGSNKIKSILIESIASH